MKKTPEKVAYLWQLGVFFFAALTAQNSPELHFRFIKFFIQPSPVGSLLRTIIFFSLFIFLKRNFVSMHSHFLKSIFGVKTLYSLYFFYKLPKNNWWTFNSGMHHLCAQIVSAQIKEMQTKIKKVLSFRQISFGCFMSFFSIPLSS